MPPRFRQRVVGDAARLTWVGTSTLTSKPDAAHPLPRRSVSQRVALQNFVGDLAMKQLDPQRPLWHYLVEDLDGRRRPATTLVVRLHHYVPTGLP